MSPVCRRRARLLAARTNAVPSWTADLAAKRGRCSRKRCTSRWAVYRVSIDLTSRASIDRLATLECAVCGHTWRRVNADAVRLTRDGMQRVLLTLILPSQSRRWYARGRWHVSGSDAIVLRNATIADADDAAREWRTRHDQYTAAAARAKAKKAEADAAAHEATMALLARLAARDAERKAEEEAASERDARAFDYAANG